LCRNQESGILRKGENIGEEGTADNILTRERERESDRDTERRNWKVEKFTSQ
jgi:hypothetical protein